MSSSSSVIAGRDSLLAERIICEVGTDCSNLANDHTTIKTVQIIYVVVGTVIFIIGCILSVFLILQQKRRWRRQREQMGLGKVATSTIPSYDPSVGRPVQNVWRGDAPPPTYSQV